jgi:molybdopterin-containing oxidoreductase family iron-sulfur binding subunit
MSHRDHHHDHDLEPIRETIRRKTGREFWRSLEELSGTDKFRDFLHREFPSLNAPDTDPSLLDPNGRRNFMKLMGASLALAGLTACTKQPKELVVPYVKTPDGLIPGKTQFYATAMPQGGVANGLLVESHEGRPTKIEGNPDHPASLGATNIQAQASVLGLYDPDRSQSVSRLGDPRTWGDFLNEFRTWIDGQRIKQGEGIRILTETLTSPTIAAQMKAVLAQFPKAKWHTYEPNTRDGARMGAQAATGQFVNTVYKFENADVVLSLDADFLTNGPGSVRYAREFINKRRLVGGSMEMNRLYVAESTMTTTGAKADHRWPIKASEVEAFAKKIAEFVNGGPGSLVIAGRAPVGVDAFIRAVAGDLIANKGKSLVIAGEHQSAAVHGIALAINNALGNIGNTVVFTDPIEINPVDQTASITELIGEMNSGKVEVLIILGGNPVYNAPNLPGEKDSFLNAMNKVANRVHLGLYNDETAANCPWHIAESHFLESWGDARAYDGTVTIIQPLIEPLYQTRTAHEVLGAILKQEGKSTYDIVRDTWKTQLGANFDQAWKQALNDGVIANSALPTKTVAASGNLSSLASAKTGQFEVVFRLDPHVHDGRYANNGWLQECPKPINKVTWDNFAIISGPTAAKLALAPHEEPYHANAKMLKITVDGKDLAMPAWIQPGHPDDSVTVYLGYGRERAGSVGNKTGFNTYLLRTTAAPWIATEGVKLAAGEGEYLLASTQEHFNLDASGIEVKAFIPEDNDLTERNIVHTGTLEQYKKDADAIHHHEKAPDREKMTIYPNWDYKETVTNDGRKMPLYNWGMTIDMQACIGCNACVVACQSENNIAVVGKHLVERGRYMHWLRIDTYFRGDSVNPEVYFQPMLCQHCEDAPCEVVCPVNATVHDAEGLNVQIYNRCVGTRYCANNCPYKVRRFNYLLYGDWETASLKNVRNPEVTIRSRGVMEKCTYCTQRIQAAKIESEKQDRDVADGEIQTACQTACPTEAIIFGDVGARSNPHGQPPQTRVAKLKAEARNYEVLADLNTRPRTSYLAVIKNPNAELGGHQGATPGHAPESQK